MRLPVILFLSLLFTASITAFGGPGKDDLSPEEKKIKKLADGYYDVEEWVYALDEYLKLDSISPDNAEYNFKIGVCYYHTTYKNKCLPHFLVAKKKRYPSDKLDFYLGRSYHFNHDFEQAVDYYGRYLKKLDTAFVEQRASYYEVERYLENCENGKTIVKDSLQIQIKNAGTAINSRFPDYAPVVSADETELLFTSRRDNSTGGKVDPIDGKYYEDIYACYKGANSDEWLPAKHLNENVNTKSHDASIGLSPDGKSLFIYRTSRGSVLSGDIYISQLGADKEWGIPTLMPVQINSKYWEGSASLTADEQIIYFSSDRPGGYGGIDIWMSRRTQSGWTEAVNLGPSVNTKYDEDAPHIHIDGKTLFFSSKGHNSIGGYDIFTCDRITDTSWTKPINIGYPINTADDDIYFSFIANGEKAYFSSYRTDSYGEKDIYTFDRPVVSRDMLLLSGVVSDEGDKKPLTATIKLTNMITGDVEQVMTTRPGTGRFGAPAKYGQKYKLTVSALGYLDQEQVIQTPDPSPSVFQTIRDFVLSKDPEYKVVDVSTMVAAKDIKMNEMPLGKRLILKNIMFDFDKSDIRAEAAIELDTLYAMLMRYPDVKVKISGHTDSRGSDKYNQRLSESRAKSVVHYLVKKGVPRKRLVAMGYGESRPIASNNTIAGRQFNRRTEFEIVDIVKPKGADDLEIETTESSTKPVDKASLPFEVWNELLPKVHFVKNESSILTQYSMDQCKVAANMFKQQQSRLLIIVGYDDESDEKDKLDLSTKRAESVKQYMVRLGISADKIQVMGYEEVSRLKSKHSNLEPGIMRRRAEFYVVD